MALDHDTIVRLLMKDRAKLYAYTWSIVHDEHVAEDVIQDVAALAIAKSDEIDDERHFLLWARKAARFRSMKAIRKRHQAPVTLDESVLAMLDAQWQQLDQESTPEAIDALRECIKGLAPNARSIIKSRYVDGLTGIELAGRLGRTAKSVYVTISRIHSALRLCIDRRLGRSEVHDG